MEFSLLPLIAFAFAASVTPGPNNALVTANAAANGWRATWPHILGNGAGFSLMIVLVGAGLAGVLAAQPLLAAAMRWGAMAWLVWLAHCLNGLTRLPQTLVVAQSNTDLRPLAAP